MHISLRYHVASIIGILCSLVLGILIGAALFQDDRLVREQGLIIAELEEQFAQMKTALAELAERERVVNESWEKVKGTLVQGLLMGETVVLVNGPQKVNWTPFKGLLQAAGAHCLEVEWQELSQRLTGGDSLLVMWLGDELAGAALLGSLRELQARGAHITFLQGIKEKYSQPQIPALYIDMADTFLGELALVLGLAGRASGHYGIKAGAQGIIPEVTIRL